MLNLFREGPKTAVIETERLIVHSREPFNAEPPLPALRASFITAQADFYVRSHGAIPVLDPAAHRVEVAGRVASPLSLSLEALRGRFAAAEVVATLQCAGNRRADMRRVRPVSGDPWAGGAIGNAAWTGVRLADVLRAAGSELDEGLHVAFACADECHVAGRSFHYGVSIPMRKALEPGVLLAWAMNGEPLEVEHGAPLRLVVPGWAGVRSPKWVVGITVQDRPSDCPIQAEDYKLYPAHVTAATADPAQGMTINAMPLNSAICEPGAFAAVAAGPVAVRGYATVGGRAVARVDVSGDGGRSWVQATLEPEAAPLAWRFWHAELELPRGEHELAVRAWDDAGQTQPALPDDTWNHRGYLSAAWHRVVVTAGP